MNPHPRTHPLHRIWADGFTKGQNNWIGKNPHKAADRTKAWMNGFYEGYKQRNKP